MPLFPRKLARDEPITIDHFNALIDAVAELRAKERDRTATGRDPDDLGLPHLKAAAPLSIRHAPAGVALSSHPPNLAELVELVTDLHIGGSATAKVLAFDGEWIEAETEEITVHDAIATFEGVAGDRALVRFHRGSGRWIVWQLKC